MTTRDLFLLKQSMANKFGSAQPAGTGRQVEAEEAKVGEIRHRCLWPASSKQANLELERRVWAVDGESRACNAINKCGERRGRARALHIAKPNAGHAISTLFSTPTGLG